MHLLPRNTTFTPLSSDGGAFFISKIRFGHAKWKSPLAYASGIRDTQIGVHVRMKKEDVIRDLQMLPEMLKRAEMNYMNVLNVKSEIKLALAEKESDLIRTGKINMKNEQTRQADLFPHLEDLQKKLLKVDDDADRLKVEYHFLKNKLESIQLIAKLILETRV